MQAINGLVSTAELDPRALDRLLSLAAAGKQARWAGRYGGLLSGKVLGLLFFNPSLRTRCSFQSGIARLGGHSIVLNQAADAWKLAFEDGAVMDGDEVEHVKEAAGVLGAYCDLMCVRSFPALKSWEEDKLDTVIGSFRRHLPVPLVNMESSMWHPCQALGDALTLKELFPGGCEGKKLVLSWAPHPKQLPMAVPNSTLLIASQLGLDVTLACPQGYELDAEVLRSAAAECERNGSSFSISHDQAQAFEGANVVYAKSWTPPQFVGRGEEERAARAALPSWTVCPELMERTASAAFMHCLPVRRNVVVADAVLDSRSSAIFRQAENRMHAQNALLAAILAGDRIEGLL